MRVALTSGRRLPFKGTRSSHYAPVLLAVAVPVLAYVALVLLGVTTSNIGVDGLRQDPGEPIGVQFGQSQSIRSDEYGTESPLWLGQSARAGSAALTPLSVSDDFFAQLPSGPVSSIVFFDGTALALSPWVPEPMLFAAKWWLPTLLLVIGLPLWFRQMTGRMRWGYLATILIIAAPASAWWSGRPVNSLGFAAAGCALAIFGVTKVWRAGWRGRVVGALAVIASGVLLARTPTYYQPLAIVLALPLVLATAAFLLARPIPWRRRFVDLALVVLSGAVWTGLLVWENREAITVGLATIYPGSRASTGTALSPGHVFGATNLGWLEPLGPTAIPNQTEIVSSFTVLLIVLAVLIGAQAWRGGRPGGLAFTVIVACGVFWLSWSIVNWGGFGAEIPLVNRVPPTRAAAGVGFIATIAFCMFLSQWRPPRRVTVAGVAAVVTGLVSAYGGSGLQQAELSGLRTWMIWLSAAIAGTVVFLLVQLPHRVWPLVVAGAAAVSLTVTANPVLFGLGDVRASATAQNFVTWGELSRADGSVWASDSGDVDALLTATGTPSLSARQQVGPDEGAWLRLDPGGAHRDMWNRGGLHIQFAWSDSRSLDFAQPAADTVVITGSPCAVAQRLPELGHIISSKSLDDSCLSEVTRVEWAGEWLTVYDVIGPIPD